MSELGLTWTAADTAADAIQHPMVRRRGDATRNAHMMSSETIGWMGKFAYALMVAGEAAPIEEILSKTPTVAEIIAQSMCMEASCCLHCMTTGPLGNLFLLIAFVLMRYRRYEEAIQYAEAAMEPDPRKAGTNAPTTRIMMRLLVGRAHSARGHAKQALPFFEEALHASAQYGLTLYEKLVSRQLECAERQQ
eukprot:SAG31_NODE_742_length_12424_cov_16.082353_8_plen_192_part_00